MEYFFFFENFYLYYNITVQHVSFCEFTLIQLPSTSGDVNLV